MFSLSKEAGILRLLVLVDGSFALLGILVALNATSQAVWLDALFSLLCASMITVESLLVDRLVEPSSVRRPNGLAACEPLLLMLKGLVLTGICLMTLVQSVDGLLHGGYATHALPLVAYGLLGVVLCGGIAVWLRSKAQHLKSPILATEQHYYRFDALISGGVTLAFIGSEALSSTSLAPLARYIDPVLSLLLVLFTLPIALRLAWQALRELLLLPADPGWHQQVQARIGAVLSLDEQQWLESRLLKQGRRLRIQLWLHPEARLLSSQEAQALCQRVQLATADCAPLLSVELVLASQHNTP